MWTLSRVARCPPLPGLVCFPDFRGFYSTGASNMLIEFGWHFLCHLQRSQVHPPSSTKGSSLSQIGLSDYSVHRRNFHYNIRLLKYWMAASLFWCLFLSTVLCLTPDLLFSRLDLIENLPPTESFPLKKDGAANYIMMVVFHLGFLLPQTALAHLDGAEAPLDH